MRLLIDECIDERVRHLFPNHDVQTARYAGFAGLSNGELVSVAEAGGFDVIVTMDQSIPFQQNVKDRRIALLILCAPTNTLRELQKIIPAALAALVSIKPGDVVRVP